MSDRGPAPKGTISQRAFAKWLGVTHTAVQQRIQAGALSRSTRALASGRVVIVDAELAAQEWQEATRPYVTAVGTDPTAAAPNGHAKEPTPAGSGSRIASPLMDATLRERNARAEAIERDNAVKAGRLIEKDEAERRERTRIIAARTKLLGLPSRAKARLPHLGAADLVVLEALIRDALDELSTAPLPTPAEIRSYFRHQGDCAPPCACGLDEVCARLALEKIPGGT